MTKLLVTFADAEVVMLDHLEPLLKDRPEAFRPATFTSKFPKAAPAGKRTHLQVELDGTPVVEYPVLQRATVRFTLYANPDNPSSAKDAAQLVAAFVSAHPGSADVSSTLVLTGPLKGVDPATKYPFASITARITLRAHALT